MHERLITGLMLAVAAVHLLPVSGFFGVERLAALYGIEIADRNLEILMRHRAILFGILGGFFAFAAFRPLFQPAAFVVASVSIVSFLYLSISLGEYNAALGKVVIADLVAAGFLLATIALYVIKPAD